MDDLGCCNDEEDDNETLASEPEPNKTREEEPQDKVKINYPVRIIKEIRSINFSNQVNIHVPCEITEAFCLSDKQFNSIQSGNPCNILRFFISTASPPKCVSLVKFRDPYTYRQYEDSVKVVKEEEKRLMTFSKYKDQKKILRKYETRESEKRLEENDDIIEIEDENGCWVPVPDPSIPGGWHYLTTPHHHYV